MYFIADLSSNKYYIHEYSGVAESPLWIILPHPFGLIKPVFRKSSQCAYGLSDVDKMKQEKTPLINVNDSFNKILVVKEVINVKKERGWYYNDECIWSLIAG